MTETRLKPGQYLALNLRAKGQDEDGSLIVEGIASDADVTDSFGTRIRFSQRALDAFNSNPICLFNHDVDNPIGTFPEVRYDGSKLRVKVKIHPEARTPSGASIPNLVRDGVLNAFSVRFDEYTTRDMKTYTQIDAGALDEISIVTLPSNKASLMTMRQKGIELHGAEELMKEAQPQVRMADSRTEDIRAAGPLSYELLSNRLAEEISELSERGWGTWPVAVFDDAVIYYSYDDRLYFSVGYSVDADGNVSLAGEASEVIPTWTPVNAGSTKERAAEPVTAEQVAAIVREELTRALAPVKAPEVKPVEVSPQELSLDDVRSALRGIAKLG